MLGQRVFWLPSRNIPVYTYSSVWEHPVFLETLLALNIINFLKFVVLKMIHSFLLNPKVFKYLKIHLLTICFLQIVWQGSYFYHQPFLNIKPNNHFLLLAVTWGYIKYNLVSSFSFFLLALSHITSSPISSCLEGELRESLKGYSRWQIKQIP